MITKFIFYTFTIIVFIGIFACNEEFLEKKPEKSLLIPETLEDFQALLDNSRQVMNVGPYLTLIADGDFRIPDQALQFMPTVNRKTYPWLDEVLPNAIDWDNAYKQVFYSNVVLDGLEKLTDKPQEQTLYKKLKGGALFYRGWALFLASQQFAARYDSKSAKTLAGIPLPLEADINQKADRRTLEETYLHIIKDLTEAEPLLDLTSEFLTRPSKPAVLALLSRVYLSMDNFEKAEFYADDCLALKNELLEYGTLPLDAAPSFPLPLQKTNPEILYYSIGNTSFTGSPSVFVDSSLYARYDQHDLRRSLFFNAKLNFKGSYSGNSNPFIGLSIDEVYLTKAECLARRGETKLAMEVLNSLLIKRWVNGKFVSLTAIDSESALKIILSERRKELVGRGTMWMDLRRLNVDERFARSLTRSIGGETFRLPPNDKRYIFKIPNDEIVHSGILQNP